MARKPQNTCRNHHPMEDPNIIYHTRGDKRVRECRECANARVRAARKAKKRNEVLNQQITDQSVVV